MDYAFTVCVRAENENQTHLTDVPFQPVSAPDCVLISKTWEPNLATHFRWWKACLFLDVRLQQNLVAAGGKQECKCSAAAAGEKRSNASGQTRWARQLSGQTGAATAFFCGDEGVRPISVGDGHDSSASEYRAQWVTH